MPTQIQSLTLKQRQILDYISDFITSEGYAPSYREIAHQFKLASTSSVAAYIRALQDKQYLAPDNGGHRSLRILHTVNSVVPDMTITELPLVGLITAGEPIEAIEEHEQISVPSTMLPDSSKSYFGLRVKGESMIEDGILDGDYIIAERRDYAHNGDIVVALLDGKYATLKRFYKEKDHIRLQPANSLMEPIRAKNVEVQGKLVGLIRKYA